MIGTSSTALMAVSASTTEQWLVVVSGLSFLGLLGVAFFFAVIQPSGSYPSPFGDQVQIERFFSESRPQVQALGAVQALVALSFLVFAASSTGVLQADAGQDASYFWVALAGGVVAGAFLLLTAILVWALSRLAIAESLPLVRALHDLAYLAGGPAHVLAVAVFLGASSLAVFTTDVLSEWVAWLGLGGAAVSAATVLAMVWHPAAWILPITRMLLAAWVLSICYQVAT
jgi:hypothetical protein